MKKNIRIKRVYDPVTSDDGARVLVDRVWPRGISKEVAELTLWLKDIAPTTQLRKWFGHDPSRWAEFRRRHHLELEANQDTIKQLHEIMKKRRVTLIYSAHDQEHNQAMALAEYLTGHEQNRDG
jgi:uncharacterized protein YeaO (DUF488 family)